jgi:beta-mannosidase
MVLPMIKNNWHFALLALGLMLIGAGCKTQSAMMTTINLNNNWTFRQVGQTTWMPATVPGTVHTDLLANGKIADPFYRTNEKELQWIDKANWEYQTTFEIDPDLLDYEAIELECLGLDTYADVYLNDSLVILADNFFVAWEKEVKKWLKPGKNHLRILFHSPTQMGLQLLEKQGYPLPATNDQSELGGMGDKRVSVFMRKPGYHFGWDWGPRLVSSGIARPIQLKAWNHIRFHQVFFQQNSLSDEKAQLTARCEVESTIGDAEALLQIWYRDTLLATQTVALQQGSNEFHVPFEIFQPQRWQTRELGTPFLYELTAKLSYHRQLSDERTHRIGLRTIRVVQTPDDKGSSFYLELNGKPIFSKGANYIPNDIFQTRVTAENYRRVIQSTVDANMNLLRIWGGGFYEEDLFYDLCDENGILVWQDFMFACSMYPGDAAFLRNVEQEAVYNVKRLRNHPCIALWCGNNEIDVAWSQYQEFSGWGWKQQYNNQQRKDIWQAYDAIFHKILPTVVGAYHPGIFYWPSSPFATPGTHATNNTPSGDIHYWGVWHAEHPFTAYYDNIGRYMSEYGFQSFPEWKTVESYTEPQDLDIESEVMAAHQRSGIGNLRIRSYMQQHYQAPSDFKNLLYVGQLLQAEGIKMAIEAHRSAMPYCMGSLYWQINDVWPVASWSSSDYFQRWKAVHYFVKKAFEPVITTALVKDGQVQIKVVSDHLTAQEGHLVLTLQDFSGKVHWTKDTQVQIPANSAAELLRFPIADIADSNAVEQMVLVVDLLAKGQSVFRNLVYLTAPKNLALPKGVAIQKEILPTPEGFLIRLKSNLLGKNVYLETPNGQEGHFSDNYFDLLPGETVEVRFTPSNHAGSARLQWLEVTVRTLAQTY